ncbi:hypothetical protein D8M31_06595 [Corynebacterium genitalium]|nr:hypothetical protein D8M31_06595 [Corynebacterium genitalium]
MDLLKPGHRDVTATETRAFSSGSKFEAGDTLMARITPCLENGKIARYLPENAAEKATGSTEFIVLRGKPGVTITDFAYYFVTTPAIHDLSVSLMTGTSGRQRVDIGALCAAEVTIPDLGTQHSIVTILGSLDDKIAANSLTAEQALELQSAFWQAGTKNVEPIPLVEVAEPILGGTPPRKDEASWNGGYKWASVADMTASPRSHLLNTAETISDVAAKKKRFSPLPPGSVLMSARGTVGRVVSIIGPTSFNQSAYGFKAKPGFDAALRLAVMSAVNELRAKSYGSVFSTITKTQIQEALVPSVFSDHAQPLHRKLNALEDLIVALEKENLVLAKTRDDLLPLLMSEKITVKEAEQEASAAGADIASEENKA